VSRRQASCVDSSTPFEPSHLSSTDDGEPPAGRGSEDRLSAGLFANVVLLLIAGHENSSLIGGAAIMLELGCSREARARPVPLACGGRG
jgi:hypothetical protein